MTRRSPSACYALPLHDALPISGAIRHRCSDSFVHWTDPAALEALLVAAVGRFAGAAFQAGDRKSTRLNSSHQIISYAVFCLKNNNEWLDDAGVDVLGGLGYGVV